jgi:hypothetical protein
MPLNYLDCSERILALSAYWREVYGEKYIAAQEKFLRWQFVDLRGGVEKDGSITVLTLEDKKGEMQGALGMIPMIFQRNGVSSDGSFVSHWNAKENADGGLLYLGLRREYPNHCVLGISQDSQRIFERIGGVIDYSVPRLCYVLEDEALNRLLPGTELGEVMEKQELKGGRFFRVSRSDERLEVSWDRYAQEVSLGVRRSLEFLRWRYFDHPFFEYHTISAREDYTGFAVLRVEKVLGEPYCVVRMVDFVPPENDEEFRCLICGVVGFAESHEAVLVDFFGTHRPTNKRIENMGWLGAKTISSLKIPRLFQPLEHREDDAMKLVVVWEGFGEEELEKAHFTKADGDQDRPIRET